MFSKRHYEAVAKVLREQQPTSGASIEVLDHWCDTVRAFVRMFNADGWGSFKPDTFREACGFVDRR